MKRRDMLRAGLAASILPAAARTVSAQTAFEPTPGPWRLFELVTRLDLASADGGARAWLPLPRFAADGWSRPGETTWTGNFAAARIEHDAKYGAQMLAVEWSPAETAPTIEAVSRIATRDRRVDLAKPGDVAPLSPAERALNLASTELLPTDGIVRETAEGIVKGRIGDLAKARAIYDWVVDNTFRDPKTRGCGVGDIASMLKAGNLGGKCADLNALFVGLCRSAGLPARDIYGLRVAASKFGYRSLGVATENVTRAQHCRAEVWLAGFGWVPVDPADVRKVALEEPPGNLPLADPKVQAANRTLFGAWEMNWLPYNVAHDVKLPGSAQPALGFLMYPQAETAKGPFDSLDPDGFKYRLTAREVAA